MIFDVQVTYYVYDIEGQDIHPVCAAGSCKEAVEYCRSHLPTGKTDVKEYFRLEKMYSAFVDGLLKG